MTESSIKKSSEIEPFNSLKELQINIEEIQEEQSRDTTSIQNTDSEEAKDETYD